MYLCFKYIISKGEFLKIKLPACTGRIVSVLQNDVNVAVAVYTALYNKTTNQPYGINAGSIVMSQLLQDAVASLTNGFAVSIFDTNVTSPNDPFLYSTASTNSSGITSQANANMIAAVL
jgi:hypothetical protein